MPFTPITPGQITRSQADAINRMLSWVEMRMREDRALSFMPSPHEFVPVQVTGRAGSGSGSSGSGSGSVPPGVWYVADEHFYDAAGAPAELPNGRRNMILRERNDLEITSFPFYTLARRELEGAVYGAMYEFDFIHGGEGGPAVLRRESAGICWMECTEAEGSGSGSGSGPPPLCVGGYKLVNQINLVDPRTNETVSTVCEDVGVCDGDPCYEPASIVCTDYTLPVTIGFPLSGVSGAGTCDASLNREYVANIREDLIPSESCVWIRCYNLESACVAFGGNSYSAVAVRALITASSPGDPGPIRLDVELYVLTNACVADNDNSGPGSAWMTYGRVITTAEIEDGEIIFPLTLPKTTISAVTVPLTITVDAI